MERDEASSLLDVLEQGGFLGWLDAIDIGVDNHRVVAGQGGGVQVGAALGVGNVDTAVGEDWDQLAGALRGAVRSLVAEEEDGQAGRSGWSFGGWGFGGSGFGGWGGCRRMAIERGKGSGGENNEREPREGQSTGCHGGGGEKTRLE